MQTLFNQTNLQFRYNPFGGITSKELVHIIVPRPQTQEIYDLIKQKTPTIIQLLGKKGRGKTTHLVLLQQLFPQYPVVFLDKNNSFSNIDLHTPILFIDSIHQLYLWQRIKLFRKIKTIVLTTHTNRFLEFKIARRTHKSYRFKGLQQTDMVDILNNRIQVALLHKSSKTDLINEALVAKLLRQYGDNLRGIINDLYAQFEQSKTHQS